MIDFWLNFDRDFSFKESLKNISELFINLTPRRKPLIITQSSFSHHATPHIIPPTQTQASSRTRKQTKLLLTANIGKDCLSINI
jgi:hypothetical protein